MDDYSIGELSIAIVSIVGAIGGLCLIIEKSKCKTIKTPCCKIDRAVREAEPVEENNLNNP